MSGQLYSQKISSTHRLRGWVEPRAGLDAVEKRKILSLLGIESLLSRPLPITVATELS
jgi:hypothetical protein